jgi:GH24 family phage-related lysozyme (muramidase)
MAANFTITAALGQLLNTLKGPQFEKNIPYMYVDTVGDVTVGVGHDLDANNDVLKLPFMVKRFERHAVLGGDVGVSIFSNKVLNRTASQSEIQNDYDFLKKHTGLGKFLAEQLQKYTTLELTTVAIDQLFLKDLKIAVAVTRQEFGETFDTFPTTCQAALIDIAFNCGSFSTFQTRFVPAVKGLGAFANKTMYERWKIASESCRRGQLSAARNAQVAKWLMDGATASKH